VKAAGWEQADPALEDLADVLADAVEAPTHVHVRALVRTLRDLPADLPQRLAEPERLDLMRALEDASDVLSDAADPTRGHMAPLVDDACRLMGILVHRLDQAAGDEK
jgi:hypothetical protein